MSSQQPILPVARYTLSNATAPLPTTAERAKQLCSSSTSKVYDTGLSIVRPLANSNIVKSAQNKYYTDIIPPVATTLDAVTSFPGNGYEWKPRKQRYPPSGPILPAQREQAIPTSSFTTRRSQSSPAPLRPASAANTRAASPAGSAHIATGASSGLAAQGRVVRRKPHWQTRLPF